uniref:Ras-GEF domain-containing protein n=1 Tax=Arcella intermedia TaxID=1963864 RepID=A0A6B2L2T1_9EUKA
MRRRRSQEELDGLDFSTAEEIKKLSSLSFTPQKRRPKQSKITKNTVLYSHAHSYPSSILKIKTDESVNPHSPNVYVLAGTIDVLIEILTHPLGKDQDFETTFIMSSDGFLSPRELFERIIQRWEGGSVTIRENIIEFFKIWLKKRKDVLEDDQTLKKDFLEWVDQMDITGLDEMKSTGFKIFIKTQLEGKNVSSQFNADVSKTEEMLHAEYLEGAPESYPILDFSLNLEYDLLSFHPEELARQLTLYDADLLKRIKPHEWLKKGWMSGKSKNITQFIDRFNLVSNWVSSMIVLGPTKSFRALLIGRFICVGMHCLLLNNYNSVLEIVSGMTSTACSRLLQTWQEVEPGMMRSLERLKELVSPANKFKALKEAQEAAEGPTIPYLGLYLNDLTLIEDGNPDVTNEELINFDKYTMVAQTILKSEDFKNKLMYRLYPVEEIQIWLKEHLLVLSEDDMFEESLQRESRELNSLLKAKLGKKANI